MILVPLALASLVVAVVFAWRRRWRDALISAMAAIVFALLYALWAQSALVAYQRQRIEQSAKSPRVRPSSATNTASGR